MKYWQCYSKSKEDVGAPENRHIVSIIHSLQNVEKDYYIFKRPQKEHQRLLQTALHEKKDNKLRSLRYWRRQQCVENMDHRFLHSFWTNWEFSRQKFIQCLFPSPHSPLFPLSLIFAGTAGEVAAVDLVPWQECGTNMWLSLQTLKSSFFIFLGLLKS